MNHKRTVVMLAIAAGSSLLVGGTAMAGITTVYVTPGYANENFGAGTLQFGLFVPELTVTDYPVPSDEEQLNSMVFGTRYAAPGVPDGDFTGNNLPLFPDLPIATPGFYLPGGLKIQGVTLDASGAFRLPSYDSETGSVNPAALANGGSFDLNDFGTGEGKAPYAYIGYCSSDKRQFGYVQLEWVSAVDWRLVGYAYGDIDEPVTVQNLVPSGGGLGLLGTAAMLRRARRVREE